MYRRLLLTAAFLFCTCGLAVAQEIPPRALLDMSKPQTAQRLVPSSPQVAITHVSEGEGGLLVTIAPGNDAFPGVKLLPESGGGTSPEVMNLSAWGHVEARLTNLNTDPLRLNLRVDNAQGSGNTPWNTEGIKIDPGRTEKITLVFGYSGGKMPGYPLRTDAVSAILLFTGKSPSEIKFRIDELKVAGPPGEKPVLPSEAIRIRPPGGKVLGPGADETAKLAVDQIAMGQGVLENNTLALTFNSTAATQAVRLRPEKGRWDLNTGSRLNVRLRNEGTIPVTPGISVASSPTEFTDTARSNQALQPGEEADLIVPFASAIPFRAAPSSDKPGNLPALPGTGTTYSSIRTHWIAFSATSTATKENPAKLRVLSIATDAGVATLPEWVGKRPPVPGDWVLTFEDTFDGNAVDLKKWNNFGPNYWDKGSHWSRENVIVKDGTATMRYEKKTGYHNDDPKQKQTDYQSGYLDTWDKFRQRYGYFESRMKLPKAAGLWPAFWTMPDRGPNSGDVPGSRAKRSSTANGGIEFDIMEYLTVWGPYRYNVAMHWDDYGPNHKNTGCKPYVEPDKDGYITAGMLWLPDQVIFYCNGIEVARWEDPRVSDVAAYLMYTLPSGGWDNNFITDGADLPDDFVIDYVRVWQRKDMASPLDLAP